MAGDTSSGAQVRQDQAVRAMSPEQRADMVVDMSEAAFSIAEVGIRLRHPGYSDQEVRLAGIRLRLGDALFEAAYPLSPLVPA